MIRSRSLARARKAARALLTSVLTVSMFFCGSPFALVAGLSGGESAAFPTAALAAGSDAASGSSAGGDALSDAWADQIDELLAAGDYEEGEAIAVVAPAAGSDAVASAAALSEEGDGAATAAAPAEEQLLDMASEELFQTTGDVYEETFDTSLPEEALDDTQALAAAEAGDGSDDVAVQASDVDVYALLVQKDGMTTEQILRELADDPRVLVAEPNYVRKIAEDTGETAATNGTADKTSSLASAATENDGTAGQTGTGTDGADDNAGDGDNGSADGAVSTKSAAEGVTPAADEVVTDAGDGTPFQWAYNEKTGNGGAVHKSEFTVKLENWNKANMLNSTEVVAIVDSGVDATNPDLANVMYDMSAYVSKIGGGKYGYGAVLGSDETDSSDVYLHGTHVAGMVAAQWNGIGVSGAANGVKLISVRVGAESGYVPDSAILRGYAYIERALDAGVNIRAINDSWSAPYGSYAQCLAFEAVGRKGAISIVASGNNSENIDNVTSSSRYFSNGDYTVIVNSASMDGTRSMFSNYGKTSTDVMAPGHRVLSTYPVSKSTFVPEMLGRSGNAAYYTFDGEDTSSITAYAGTSVDDSKKIGSVKKADAGYDATGVFEVSNADLQKCTDSVGAGFDMTLKVPVDGSSLDQLSNIGASLAAAGTDDQQLAFNLSVDSQDASGKDNSVTEGGSTSASLLPSDWTPVKMNVASALEEDTQSKESKLSVYTDTDGTRYIVLHLRFVPQDTEDIKTTSILIDCLGAGNKIVPYAYLSGTSMATPCVTGLAAVAACQMGGYKDHDAASAAALAQTVKSSVNTFSGQFNGICTSNGMIDASKFSASSAKAPAISAATLVEPDTDGEDSLVNITGSNFGAEKGTVKFGGKTAEVKSWSDTEVQIICPSGLTSGRIECELTTAAGKSCTHAETYRFTKNVSADELPTFEETIELPDAFSTSTVYNEIAALDGSLYVFEAEEYVLENVTADNANNANAIYSTVWRYDTEAGTWSRAESLPARLGNVSTALWNGKLLVMGAGESEIAGGLTSKKLFSLDPATGKWTDLSDKVAADDVPCQASLVNAGGRLLLIGGSELVESDGSKSIKDLDIDNIRSFDFETGEVKVLGTGQPRSNAGQERAYANIQTALVGNKVYVFGGAMRSSGMGSQPVIDCITLDDDGSITVENIGTTDGREGGLLPASAGYDESNFGVASIKGGLVMAARRTTAGLDENSDPIGFVQDDTFVLKTGASKFESLGKRVAAANVTFSRAIAYRGKLYVIGHNFEGSCEPIMRATAVETEEIPGDVVRKKDETGKKDEGDGAVKKTTVKTVTSVLPATGDVTLAAAAACAIAAAGLLLVARRLRDSRQH